MKIVSDFKDYYDVGMGQGQDLTLVYNRFQKIEEKDHFPFPRFFTHGGPYWLSANSISVDTIVVGFCGRIYPILSVNLGEHGGLDNKESRKTHEYCFNYDEVDNYVKIHFKDKIYQGFHEKGYNRKNAWQYHQRADDFQRFFAGRDAMTPWGKLQEKDQKYFVPDRCPLFLCRSVERKSISKAEIVYNACLKNVEFYRQFDPYQAFQEISMWLGNQAEPRKPIPEMSDEIKASAHGYNEWSFRKPPSKKR